MTLGGRRLSRFFADARHGGEGPALAAAKRYRDGLITRRRPRKVKPNPLLIKRGGSEWYQIRLPKPGGGTTTTEFSLRRHGSRGARRLAVQAWMEAAG
jgi:hypothetical protein